jgi:hypothetical protein
MDMNCLPFQEFGRISTNCISLFQTEDLDVIFIGWVIMTSDVNSNMILVQPQTCHKLYLIMFYGVYLPWTSGNIFIGQDKGRNLLQILTSGLN